LISELLQCTDIIYRYIKTAKNQAMTYMDINPQQARVEREVTFLNFSIQNSGKKDAVITDVKKVKDKESKRR